MPDFYSQMQGIAKQLLTDYKQGTMTLDVYTAGSGPVYNPGPPTYTPQPFNGVARGTNAQDLADSMVQVTDLVVTIPADTLTPKLTDRVTIDGLQYSVVKIIRSPAAGTAVVWQVTVRA